LIQRKRIKATAGAFVFLIVAMANASSPGENGGAIQGKVTDSGTNRGIEGARVSMNLGLEIRAAVTDSSGTFSLVNLPEGAGLPVTVEKEGYRAVRTAVTVIVGKTAEFLVSLDDTYLKLLSFQGGRYIAGTDVEVRWEAIGIGAVRIEFSPNGGRAWLLLAEGADSRRGFWLWTVPDMPTANGLIRITAPGRGDISDRSDQPFSISSI
jgi:hypothetical protein